MARLANIVPNSCNTFDPRRHLTRCDVASNELGLIVTFHCIKTIQFGERKLHIPLFEGRSSQLYTQLMQLRKESLKKFRLVRDSNP